MSGEEAFKGAVTGSKRVAKSPRLTATLELEQKDLCFPTTSAVLSPTSEKPSCEEAHKDSYLPPTKATLNLIQEPEVLVSNKVRLEGTPYEEDKTGKVSREGSYRTEDSIATTCEYEDAKMEVVRVMGGSSVTNEERISDVESQEAFYSESGGTTSTQGEEYVDADLATEMDDTLSASNFSSPGEKHENFLLSLVECASPTLEAPKSELEKSVAVKELAGKTLTLREATSEQKSEKVKHALVEALVTCEEAQEDIKSSKDAVSGGKSKKVESPVEDMMITEAEQTPEKAEFIPVEVLVNAEDGVELSPGTTSELNSKQRTVEIDECGSSAMDDVSVAMEAEEEGHSKEAMPTVGEVVTDAMMEEEKRLKEGGSRESSMECEAQRGEVRSHNTVGSSGRYIQ